MTSLRHVNNLPLFIFSPKLWACRIKGLGDYMEFSSSYINGFDQKWLGADAPQRALIWRGRHGKQLNIVRDMRWVPLNRRLSTGFVIAALMPVLPLLLLKYPVAELAMKVFASMSGL